MAFSPWATAVRSSNGGELKPGALQGMLKQLDIPREDF